MGRTGLSAVQRKFLRKFRWEVKSVREMLRECRVGMGRLQEWRGEEAFAREFRRATAGLVQDTLGELRVAFAVCGRMIAEEVRAVERELVEAENEMVRKAVEDAVTKALKAAGVALEEKKKEEVVTKSVKKAGRKKLDGSDYRFCIDVVKLGTATFVGKRAPRRVRRAFPEVDMEAFGRLERAQGWVTGEENAREVRVIKVGGEEAGAGRGEGGSGGELGGVVDLGRVDGVAEFVGTEVDEGRRDVGGDDGTH